MSEGKIVYRVMAVKEREPIVSQLIKTLNSSDVIVFWDTERKGCAWNALRCWESVRDSDADYICVIQDDVEVVKNFCEIAKIVAKVFPDSIVSFYNQGLTKSDFNGAVYGILPTCAISGPAIMMPKKIALDFVDFFNRRIPKPFDYDDAAIRIFAIINGIQTITMCPSLARCVDNVESTFGNSHSQKNTLVWCGRDVDMSMFLKRSVSVIRPASIRTHLPKDHPLRIAVERQVSILKKVYK